MKESDLVPKVRSFSSPVWLTRLLIFMFTAIVLAVAGYGIYSWKAMRDFDERSLHLEVLLEQKGASVEQILAFKERVKDIEGRLESLKNREEDLNLLTRDFNRELGLPETASLEKIWPALISSVAWTWGGAEAKGGVSPEPPGSRDWLKSSDNIKSLHLELDRLERRATEVEMAIGELTSVLEGSKAMVSATPSIMPLANYRLSSRFGYRLSPFGGGSDFHKGLDLVAPVGTPVRSPAEGLVLSSDWSINGYGLMVTIDHGFGLLTRYAHLSESLVSPGQKVARGEVVAKVGNTGRSTGPHLHFETLVGGIQIDPLMFSRGEFDIAASAE
jgi:hypothetical protein